MTGKRFNGSSFGLSLMVAMMMQLIICIKFKMIVTTLFSQTILKLKAYWNGPFS